jgi:hypothetical protein|tara:strand:+ start:186 stop:485 length:300 start_codon:yes stop_codon:yes gene_type:complete
MIKAMLVITALSGGADYRVEMPSMESCMSARSSIMKQDNTVNTLCIPRENETAKISKFFDMFTSMVERMREMDRDEGRGTQDDESQNFFGYDRTRKCGE